MEIFKIFGSKPSSKDVAKERLKLILIHDRANFSPDLLEMIKADIIKVISNYVDIDDGEIDVKVTTAEAYEGEAPALITSIPIRSLKGRNSSR